MIPTIPTEAAIDIVFFHFIGFLCCFISVLARVIPFNTASSYAFEFISNSPPLTSIEVLASLFLNDS